MMSAPLLSVHDLHFAWPNGGRKVLDGLNLELGQGQSLGLHGANGSGKTTLFRCITGLLKPGKGEIRLYGRLVEKEKDFIKLRRRIGFCLQNAEDQIIFPSVLEDVSFGPLNLGMDAAEARELAEKTLVRVGLPDFGPRSPHHLSGGEQRLVALAGILAMRPEAILLDEPLNGLDELAAGRVARIIAGLECAKIVVAHDAEFIASVCDSSLRLQNGRLVAA